MIKIGDFANIFDISIKTVRLYESMNLFTPAYVDIYTGYRYYDEKNIKEMSKILALKNLGLELKEIKHFDETKIDAQIEKYQNKIDNLKNNIDTLKSLKEERKIENMETFINDNSIIGKWKLIAVADTKDDYYKNNIQNTDDIAIKELYLMKGGKKYWIISWTKGFINIKDKKCPYTVENNIMFVNVPGLYEDTKVLIYEKVNNKEYSVDEIITKDNINLPFVKDDNLVGFYKSIDYIKNIDTYIPKKSENKDLFLEKIAISPNDDVYINYKNGNVRTTKYTKGYIINLPADDTLCKYIIKNINNKTYLIVEWKNGDYVFSKTLSGYYVLEKIQ